MVDSLGGTEAISALIGLLATDGPRAGCRRTPFRNMGMSFLESLEETLAGKNREFTAERAKEAGYREVDVLRQLCVGLKREGDSQLGIGCNYSGGEGTKDGEQDSGGSDREGGRLCRSVSAVAEGGGDSGAGTRRQAGIGRREGDGKHGSINPVAQGAGSRLGVSCPSGAGVQVHGGVVGSIAVYIGADSCCEVGRSTRLEAVEQNRGGRERQQGIAAGELDVDIPGRPL